jgi:transcriptional regulator with XRE-family HTH domain
VAKTVEQPEADGRSSRDLGRQLRQVRRKQGLSRAEVARSAGLTRRELAAYERGRIVIPESDLWCLAGSCGVDVNELLPDRTPLRIGSGLSSLAMGDSIRRLREPGQPEGLLREYLSMVYELRNLPPGSRIPLRESDLVILADALGGTPDVIEERLIELIGASHEEAARLRAMILPPLSLPSGLPSSTDPYAAYGAPDEQSPVVDFFSAPRAQDPFSTQPSPVATAPPVGPPATHLPMPDLPMPDLQGPTLQPPAGTTLGTDPIDAIPYDPFAVAGASTTTFGESDNPFDPGTPFTTGAPLGTGPVEQTELDTTPNESTSFEQSPFATSPFDPVPLDGATAFDTNGDGNGAGEPAFDPFSGPMPQLRPDPFGVTPTTNGHDGIDGFVVDVPEGPLAEMSTSTDETLLDAPLTEAADADVTTNGHRDPLALEVGSFEVDAVEAAPTDWVGIRNAAAVADAPPEVVLGDGWGAPAIDETTPDLPVPDLPFDAAAEVLLPDALEPDALRLGASPLDALTSDGLITSPPTREPTDEPDAPDTDLDLAVVSEPFAPTDVAPTDAAPIAWRAEASTADLVGADLLVPVGPGQFESAGTGWQVGGLFPATAMADDGALALRRADTRWALSDLEAPHDFTVEAVLDYSAGTGFGVLFRASVDAHERVTGYSFDIDPIAGGGGYLVRQWDDNRAHWRPIAQATVTDPAELYGRHQITLTVQGDRLGVFIDNENVLAVPALSRASIELGREPCRGSGLGVHAGATTELTVERFRAARH